MSPARLANPTLLRTLAVVLLSSCMASAARADFVVSTVNFLATQPQHAAGAVRLHEESGTLLTAAGIPPFSSMAGPFAPGDIAVSPGGDIFIADVFQGSILHFDGRTGAPLPSPLPGAPDGLFANVGASGGLVFTSIEFGNDGRLYAADATLGAVRVYAGPDSVTPGLQIDTLLDAPTVATSGLASLTFDHSGRLLVSDNSGQRIYRVNVSTDVDEVFIDTVSQFESRGPAGLAVDATGAVLIADPGHSTIVKYDSNGQNPSIFATLPTFPGDTDGSANPTDVLIDRNGDVVVTALGGSFVIGANLGRVLRYSSSGTFLQTVADGLVPASGIDLIEDLLAGDFAGTGTVDAASYTIWRDTLGSTVIATYGADGNSNGVIDPADYTVWRDTFGDTAIASSLASVPEPASVLLLVAAGIATAARKWPVCAPSSVQ